MRARERKSILSKSGDLRPFLAKHILFFGLVILPLLAMGAQLELSRELLERQKQLYTTNQWDSFFGGAVYLRADNPDVAVLDHGFALELMALARHCQWGVIRDLEHSAPQLFLLPLAKKTMAFIRLKKDFQQFSKDAVLDRQSALQSLKASRDRWKVTAQELRSLTSPQQLKMHVRSLCVFP